ncbi:MAG: hypothetical protein AB1806_16175 [Acidobacteriota bacterium]
MSATCACRHSLGGPRLICAVTVLLTGLTGQPALAGEAAPQNPPAQPAGQAAPPVAQAAPPYRGLFGAGSPAAPGGHALDLTTSIYQEYGNTVDDAGLALADVLTTGWFMGMRGGLSFEKAGRDTRFGLRGEGAFRYYRDTNLTTSPRFRLDVGVDSRTGTRGQNILRLGGSVDYEPYYILPLFPSAAPVTGGAAILPSSRDDLIFRRNRYIYGQTLGLERQVSPRTYVSIHEEARYTEADTPGLDVRSVRVGARYGYRVTRNASLRLGYAYQTGRYGTDAAQQMEAHDVDISLDYQRPLTRSRRTTFGFGAGSSRITAQANRKWEIVGTVNLRHEFEMGWFLQGDFRRTVQLVEGFADPFMVNTVTGSLGGFMGRRVELLASGGYSRGVIGFGADSYDALQGSARLRLALARFLAVDAEALANQYTFAAQVPLPPGVPAALNRWAVRWNVSLWLPLSR